MWKALLVLALVGLFLVGSLMTLKYTARTGLPKKRTDRGALPAPQQNDAPEGERNLSVTSPRQAQDRSGPAGKSPTDERNG